MVRLFARHDIDDYDRWREAYDAFEPVRAEVGVRGAAVYRTAGNPSEVTVTHDFDSVAAAEAFMQDPRVGEAMERAGVTGAPQIWIAEVA